MAYSEDVNINLNILAGAMGGITAIMGGMSALTSTFGQFGTEAVDNFGAVDGLLVTTTALLVSFGAQAAEAFGEFEQGMKIVQTVSGQTGYAINELSNKANEMSVHYRTAIGDITEGLQTLGRAGLNSAATQIKVLESGLQTAKLEGRNLNGVLEEIIQNTAMLGGDLKSIDFGAQSEYLNSIMVGTSMTAPIDSHDISQTLQYAGGTAAAAGARFDAPGGEEKIEDLMGTIAAFAQKGVKGSMAGTALRAFFTKPASQDESVTDALGQLGLTPEDLWEDGGQSMKKVSDQVGLIQRQMEALNLSTMDQVEIWGKIVGPKMGQQMMKLEASSIKELTRDIQSAQSAEDLATKTLQTYTQKISAMQQQGEVAFREFGEKVVVFLTPIVDIITVILGALSNPFINTAAFTAFGALVTHGIRKAWAMASSVINQIRGLLGGVATGIEQINALAGGSATGFANTVSEVDVLNSRLAQTNVELQALQAQFLKIHGLSNTGTYVPPLGLTNSQGKLRQNIIATAPQNVHVGDGVVGAKGAYYDPSDVKGLKEEYKKAMETQNAQHKEAINNAYATRVSEDKNGVTRYRDSTGKFMSKSAFEKEMQGHQSKIMSSKEIDKAVAKSVETGSKQIHSSMVSMTEQEYKRWMNSLKNSADPLKQFNYQRQKELEKHAGARATNTVDGQKFHRVVRFDPIQKRFNEYERLLQKEGQFKQFEQSRASVIQQQKALVGGQRQGISARAQQVVTRRMQAYSNTLSRVTRATRSFGSNIKTSAQRLIGTFNILGQNVQSNVRASIAVMSEEIRAGSISVEQALIRLSQETGLTQAELAFLNKETGLLTTLFEGLNAVTAEGIPVKQVELTERMAEVSAIEGSIAMRIKEAAMGGIKSLVGFMGGPLMFAMMGFMAGMQAIQRSQQAWQESMQEAANQLSEATDGLSESEDKIKEIYSSENSNMTDANLDKALDEQYATISETFYGNNHIGHYETNRDDLGRAEFEQDVDISGDSEKQTLLTAEEIQAKQDAVDNITLAKDENVKALNDNTMALTASVNAYNDAQNKQVKGFTDGTWGFDSFGSDFTDQLGEWQEEIWNIGSWFTVDDAREGFLDSNSPVLSGSQADSNYAGSTEFAGIFSADVFRFGITEGLKQFFGSDYDQIISLMHSMDKKVGAYGEMSGYSALQTHAANFASGPLLTQDNMGLMQMSLKNNKEDYQKLGKQMFRYEQQRGLKSGHTAYDDWKTGTLTQKTRGTGADKNRYSRREIAKSKWTVQDKNLDRTIKKLMALTDNKLSYQNVLAMGQLQQLQDMYAVANETVAPGIMQTVQGVYQNVSATGQAAGEAGNAAGGAVGASQNAAAIAAFLGAQATDTAMKSGFNEYIASGDEIIYNGHVVTDENEFRKAISDMSKGEGTTEYKYRRNIEESLGGTGVTLNHPGASQEYIKENATRHADDVEEQAAKNNASFADILNTLVQPTVQYAQGAVLSAYDQSTVGEYGGGQRNTGNGSGGSGGDGDSDKGSDTGSTRSRVDLVLCSKKTIPKLNVNLFKKAPNFTILNKNFKLRDIKINSQDKPDAITDAIKNGIIETQKRMDPKIIQSEESVYDPVTSTDGTSIPSGNTPVNSDR